MTCVPVTLETLAGASTVWSVWFAISWASWGVLWFLFFVILALGRTELTRATWAICAAQGVYAGWVPGYLLLSGLMPGGPVPAA